MERLKRMKEALMNCAEGQIMGNIDKVDTKELGEVVDMIKDFAEAIYYCSIAEAMEKEEEKGEAHKMYFNPRMYPMEGYDPRQRDENYPMYSRANRGGIYWGTSPYSGDGYDSSMKGINVRGGGTRGYREGMIPYELDNRPHERDPREGKSGERRKMYMEGKGMQDKHKQMQELESYMQELGQDLTEMIQDASAEEKQLLQQKIATLAQKIK